MSYGMRKGKTPRTTLIKNLTEYLLCDYQNDKLYGSPYVTMVHYHIAGKSFSKYNVVYCLVMVCAFICYINSNVSAVTVLTRLLLSFHVSLIQ